MLRNLVNFGLDVWTNNWFAVFTSYSPNVKLVRPFSANFPSFQWCELWAQLYQTTAAPAADKMDEIAKLPTIIIRRHSLYLMPTTGPATLKRKTHLQVSTMPASMVCLHSLSRKHLTPLQNTIGDIWIWAEHCCLLWSYYDSSSWRERDARPGKWLTGISLNFSAKQLQKSRHAQATLLCSYKKVCRKRGTVNRGFPSHQ